jgi:serine/threonine protein kinase
MTRPDLTVEQVQTIIPHATEINFIERGGQKIVFAGIIDGEKYALKFMSADQPQNENIDHQSIDNDVAARAKREVATMQQCDTPYLVKMGSMGLQTHQLGDQNLLYFSEEFIEGQNLRHVLKQKGVFCKDDLIRLAWQISEAIEVLWGFNKIHRDIKPGNIMRNSQTGDFILLDMGLVFDFQGESHSMGPVGTPMYFAPEQLDFKNRRVAMDFRSDMFPLGIVLYEMATGQHPFFTTNNMTLIDVLGSIINNDPQQPISLRSDLPQALNDVIMRLLAKRRALRYRNFSFFRAALDRIKDRGEDT